MEARGYAGARARPVGHSAGMPDVVVPLTIRDLTAADLPACAWAGPPVRLAAICRALDRAAAGEVDYLAVCPPSGQPVGLGAVDYAASPDAGYLWMLAVHGALQSCGIGTLLVAAAEDRIRARGRRRAELGVEDSNPRARSLYERLGYAAYGRRPGAWDEEAADGSLRHYETMLTLLGKDLPLAARTSAGPDLSRTGRKPPSEQE